MTALNVLLEQPARTEVAKELAALVDSTVATQTGLTGMALKSALGAAKKADADAVTKGVDQGLPMIVSQLEPFWNDYQASGEHNFGGFLVTREEDVVKAILDAGDKAIGDAPGAIQKVYSSMRGKAAKIVGPSLPEFGNIIERFAK